MTAHWVMAVCVEACGHTHDERFQDWPFACKAKHWRASQAPGVTYQMGQWMFHETTRKRWTQDEIAKGAASGRTLVPCDADGNY